MSLKLVAKTEAVTVLELSGRLEALPWKAGMFRAQSKDHE